MTVKNTSFQCFKFNTLKIMLRFTLFAFLSKHYKRSSSVELQEFVGFFHLLNLDSITQLDQKPRPVILEFTGQINNINRFTKLMVLNKSGSINITY